MVAEEEWWGGAPVWVPNHAEPSRDDREGQGADEAHLVHGGSQVGPPFAQAMVRGRGLLAFCMLARHVAVVVELRLVLLLPELGGTRGLTGPALAFRGA